MKRVPSLAKIGGMDRTRYISYRKHFPWEIDENLKKFGFQKAGYRFFHFYPFFTPFDKLFPAAFIKLGLKMEALSASVLECSARDTS